MSTEPKPGVMGSLPRTRPHRRSDKRPAPAAAPPLDAQAQEPAVVTAAAPDVAKAAAPPKVRAAKKPAAPRRAKPKPAAAKRAAATPRTARPASATPRTARPASATPWTAEPTAATPAPPTPRDPSPGVLETAVQAAAELTEIGLCAAPSRACPARRRVSPAVHNSSGAVAYTAPPPAERSLLRERSTGEPLAGCRRPAGANRSR
jgi:demethylmenaquinone methyltransferase/2-methoxy-6-polyprenyl-1,4-benzoquinol methylase